MLGDVKSMLNQALNRSFGLSVYRPARNKVVPRDALTVTREQNIYDPAVFGTYDLATQRVVSKQGAASSPFSLDLLPAHAQRHNAGGATLDPDRYHATLAWLPPGRGVCLDACSAHPRQDVRERVSAAGYEYLPIDIEPFPGVRQEDLTQLTFRDETIACVLSVDTLEHIADYRAAISEIFRVLEPGGAALLHLPCYYFDKPAGEPIRPGIDPWGHTRYFSARELLAAYEAAGFVNLRTAFLFDYGAVLSALAKPRKS